MIRAATDLAIRDLGVCRAVARVKAGNAKSVAAFRRAGFAIGETREITGVDAVAIVYESGRDEARVGPVFGAGGEVR